MTAPERRYQLLRLGAGDYLLTANDDRTLWRIYAYDEDGSATRMDAAGRWRPVVGRFWAAAKFRGSPEAFVAGAPDKLDWGNLDAYWDTWSQSARTRREAIDDALAAAERWSAAEDSRVSAHPG